MTWLKLAVLTLDVLAPPFSHCILLRITRYNEHLYSRYNDYVMRPRSYSRGLRNRKTYANVTYANANANANGQCCAFAVRRYA